MLHPSKYYQMHPQLTAGTPRSPPGAPKGPQKFNTIVYENQFLSCFLIELTFKVILGHGACKKEIISKTG